MSNIFQVYNKDTSTTPSASVVNYEHISRCSTIIIGEFDQIKAVSVLEIIVSDNKLFPELREIYCPTGWENFFDYMFSSLFARNKVAKG